MRNPKLRSAKSGFMFARQRRHTDPEAPMIAWTIYLTFAGAIVFAFPAAKSWRAGSRLPRPQAGLAIGLVAFCRSSDLGSFSDDRPPSLDPVLGMELSPRGRWHQPHAGPGDRPDRGLRGSFLLGRRDSGLTNSSSGCSSSSAGPTAFSSAPICSCSSSSTSW